MIASNIIFVFLGDRILHSAPIFSALSYLSTLLLFTINKEIEWYADDRKSLIATIFIDKFDKDWSFVILGRDARKIYRCIYTGVSFESIEDAHKELKQKLNEFS